MKALVLSGGGSKGSYQIGVWKALRRLNIHFDLVTGTSSGAINGALITQGSYLKSIFIWRKLNNKNIFGKDFNPENNISHLYASFAKNCILEGGTAVEDLQKLINKSLHKRRFYHSKINYGLVTYNLTNRKAVSLEKKDIPKEKLGDYILASASCFPAFKKKDIDGNKYIDGGYYDNLPINLAIDMGADEAIIVDLEAIGVKRKAKKRINSTIIKPNNELSNFLVFDPSLSKRNMRYGYNDTMKVYGKLEGKKFTFKKNHLKKLEDKYLELYKELLLKILNTNELISIFSKKVLNSELTKKIERRAFDKLIEDIGYHYKLDDSKIYSARSFNRTLKKRVKYLIKTNNIDDSVKMYQLLENENYKKLRKEALLRPIDLATAIYIYIVLEG